MNRRNDFRRGRDRIQNERPSSRRGAQKHEETQQSGATDASITGFESRYLSSLMETSSPIVVVLQQGERVAGRLVWYDQGCLKITPTDGSPSLLIPKISIKYLHEAIFQLVDRSDDSQNKEIRHRPDLLRSRREIETDLE
jgi:hypothetical protein